MIKNTAEDIQSYYRGNALLWFMKAGMLLGMERKMTFRRLFLFEEPKMELPIGGNK